MGNTEKDTITLYYTVNFEYGLPVNCGPLRDTLSEAIGDEEEFLSHYSFPEDDYMFPESYTSSVAFEKEEEFIFQGKKYLVFQNHEKRASFSYHGDHVYVEECQTEVFPGKIVKNRTLVRDNALKRELWLLWKEKKTKGEERDG